MQQISPQEVYKTLRYIYLLNLNIGVTDIQRSVYIFVIVNNSVDNRL